MSIVFVTKWSDYFESPFVEVFAYDRQKRVTSAIPYNSKLVIEDENGRVLTEDSARKACYASAISEKLKEDQFNLGQVEIDVIIEFLMNNDNFYQFEKFIAGSTSPAIVK